MRAGFGRVYDSSEKLQEQWSSFPKQPTPPTPQKRRLDPRGIYLGMWRGSGLHADKANAVYGLGDKKNRINRRIFKEMASGAVVVGGRMDAKKTACSHEEVDHIPSFEGMSDDEVKSLIMPLLQI